MSTGEQAQFDVLTMYAADKSVWLGFLVVWGSSDAN